MQRADLAEGAWRLSTARLAVVCCVPVAVGIALFGELRQPFDPVRLAVKSAVPFAALLPAVALFPAGTARARLSAALELLAIAGATAACLAVFGIQLRSTILLPLLLLTRFEVAPFAVAAALLAVVVAIRSIRGNGFAAWSAPSDLPIAAAEAVYFAGFLLASTTHLGGWSWSIVALGMALAATVRGVSLLRAAFGAASCVAMTVWSESPYAVFVVHLALLGSVRCSATRQGTPALAARI